MRRHVVWAFTAIEGQGIAIADEPCKEPLEIVLNVRVCVLLDHQTRERMTDGQSHRSLVDLACADFFENGVSHVYEPTASDMNRKVALVLMKV